jgi:hypothetical protein
MSVSSYWDEKHSEDFQEKCREVGHYITSKRALNIMTCIDGSSQSDLAFQSALNMRRKFDHINVFHAYRGMSKLMLFALSPI